ncbi:LamG domain-containing protein [Colwellia sp. 12G3]|uniref:LamG domain-containing protein n=1 Tax=Colwellia sp. 12G3 TaxID=2058299 RepID=UPI000C33DE5D|nr:LamG domain-containing protein [Colwellia sp. 12G3]PKI13148.1 hypothetical protein CXF71_20870 [Colwellia sp. 12G3]
MNKLLPIYIVLFFSLISVKVLAVCSAHSGNATLNEIMKEGGNGGVFIEIELLDLAISSVIYDQWTIRICHDEGNGNNQSSECKDISVADMNDATQWIWVEDPIIDKGFIDFQDGFDLSLLDKSGQFIDYIQVGNYSGQNFPVPLPDQCGYNELEYVFPIPNDITNGTKILLRKPDGTGEWLESKNLNEYPATPGGGNDGSSGAALVVDYRLEETLWDGSVAEVVDNTGNGNNGQSLNGANTNDAFSALTGSPGTCGYGEFDGVDAHVSIPDNDLLDMSDSLTITAWVYPTKAAQQVIVSKARRNSNKNNYQLSLGAGNTLLFQYNSGGVGKSVSTFTSVPIDTWSHVAITYTDGVQRFYINGVQTDTGNNTGILDTNDTTLDIGGEISWDNLPNGAFFFEGRIDEVRVYDGALTGAEVRVVASETHDCSSLLIAYYQMDELAWNGTSNEVVNQVRNSLHGTAIRGAKTDNITPALPGPLGTCGYGTFDDGRREYVQVDDDDALDFTDELTITTWIYPTRLPTGNNLMSILSKDENYEFHVDSAGKIFWWWDTDNFRTDNAVIVELNKWYHIAITYKSGQQYIYVNGQVAGDNDHLGLLNTNNDPLQIGQDQGFNGRYFEGYIDEVKIYDGALSDTEVYDIFEERHPCESFIDHFEIDALNGQGLTCEVDTVTLRACSDASCNTLNHDNFLVSLTVSEGNNPVLTKEVTIVGGEVNIDYRYTKLGIATLSLDQTFECINGSPTDCDVTFVDAGFRFVADKSGTALPLQLSGKPSDIGFNADTLRIEAVKADPLDPSACIPLLIGDPADVAVIDMAASYQSPISGSQSVNISGTDIDTAVSGTAFDDLPFSGVTLDFSDLPQNSAEYIFTYPNAGSIVLNARYELPDDEGNPSGDFIKGTSNPIIVRPFAFDLFVDKNLPTGDTAYKVNPAATDGSGGEEDVFTVAADEIRINTRAVAWKTGDDANANGLADQGEDLTTNATTNNFIDVSLSNLSHTQLLPTSDIDGTLSVETGAEFTFGSQVDIATYDEVGIISLQALKEDYLAAGVSIEGNTPYVGRFIPSHFTITSIADGILTGTCSVGDSTELPFVYSGQMLSGSPTKGALSYLTTPSFVIEARNKDDVLTQNYIDDFLKLSLTSFQRLMVPNFAVPSVSTLAPVTDTSRMGKDTTNLVRLTANLDDANFTGVKGVISYSYHDDDNFVYAHEENSEVNEFTSDIDLSMVSIIDSDSVAAQDYDLDSANGLILTLKPSGKLIRFGRAQLANSYGPDTSDLPQTLSVNYYTDDGYVLSKNDTCTTYDYNNISLSNISLDPALTPVQVIVPGKFSDELPLGETRDIILEAPTDSIKGVNTGQVGVIYNISDWLQYDWAYDTEGVDGLFNDNPRGIATFGIYRGNDRIIYQREIEKTN